MYAADELSRRHLQNGYLQIHFAGAMRINKKMAFDMEKVCHQNSSTGNKVATIKILLTMCEKFLKSGT